MIINPDVAQIEEHLRWDQGVVGAVPTIRTNFIDRARGDQ